MVNCHISRVLLYVYSSEESHPCHQSGNRTHHRLFPMDTPNASNSDCELVSENELVSKAKGKKTQRKKQDGKSPSAPQSAQTV
ncbi:hypothetical protein HanPSC8_Chr13g0586411 [Helianthus annuus]|nr:hypothetical protein HanPSC8_Chr13g0586411 [Helianthus annuus]